MTNDKREKTKGDQNNRVKKYNIIQILLNVICIIEGINSNTIVELNINGIGEQKILSNEFLKPNETYVNGENQNYTEYYNLAKLENNIIMKWYNKLSDLNNMFSNGINITKMDFANGILSTININAICKLSTLISLNLNNFEIDGVHDKNIMGNMFSGCSSLISLNLNNFSIISGSDNNMENMFSGCSSLISLNLNIFQ